MLCENKSFLWWLYFNLFLFCANFMSYIGSGVFLTESHFSLLKLFCYLQLSHALFTLFYASETLDFHFRWLFSSLLDRIFI